MAFFCGAAPAFAAVPVPSYVDAQSRRMMALLDGRPCSARVAFAQAQATSPASPTPAPTATPTFAPITGTGGGAFYATPFPTGSPGVTAPPVPTPTPAPGGSPGPVFLVRPTGSPSIAPAVPYGTTPSPAPSAGPTLPPGYVAVMADKITGSTKPGIPGDATGNVHIFFQDEVLIGDRAHYDGIKTITVTGHPYIINNAKNSVLYADKIVFDTLAQKAYLYKGRGESSQGVEKGLVYYSAQDMRTDEHGIAHGNYASLTTCAKPRGGYHITGRTIDVIPSDRIVITKAILWLGAAAVFFLPKVIIPLRTVSDQRQKPQFFPDMGYNSYQGYYVRAKVGFGKDQYYYGTYDIEFYTKQGLTLGYNGSITKKNGKRSTQISVQRVENKIEGSTQYNANMADVENISKTIRAQLGFTYTGAYGPYTNFPPQENYTLGVTHSALHGSQSYTFQRSTTGSQSNNTSYGFTDQRSFSQDLQNNFGVTLSRQASAYGGFTSSNSAANLNELLHWAGHGMDYQLTYAKAFAKTPYGINKEPEIQIKPQRFLPHFVFPITPTFTVGEYNEPQTPETTSRAEFALPMGPLLYKFAGSDFSANVTVQQYLYGTGDEKASVQQQASLTTQAGPHVVNSITYSEDNYNGPAAVPFSTIDVQNGINTKNATDDVRLYNGQIYNLQLSFPTAFNGIAQPVAYVLTTQPSQRSYATFSGSYAPGPGLGFYETQFELSTPFGRGSFLQFLGDVNWKEKSRIENKSIYYSHIVGDCYMIQIQYNQSARTVNVTLSLLAFPSHAASFGLTNSGSILPSSLNGFNGI